MPNISNDTNLLIRDFYEQVASRDELFPDTPATARQLRGICLGLLGYVVSHGKIVRPEDVRNITYGQTPDLKDRWAEDTAALRATVGGSDTSQADSSE